MILKICYAFVFKIRYVMEQINKPRNRYHLALCELHCAKIHGGKEIGYHLIINKFSQFSFTEFFEDVDDDNSETDDDSLDNQNNQLYDMYDLIELYTEKYKSISERYGVKNPHRLIKNYLDIISRNDYIKPEIILSLKLSSGYSVAIIKTFWLKIIQRTWKKVFSEKNRIWNQRKSIRDLSYRSIHGKWSNTIPTLKGMLFYLR